MGNRNPLGDAVRLVFELTFEVRYIGNGLGERQRNRIPLVLAMPCRGNASILGVELQPRVAVVGVTKSAGVGLPQKARFS